MDFIDYLRVANLSHVLSALHDSFHGSSVAPVQHLKHTWSVLEYSLEWFLNA